METNPQQNTNGSSVSDRTVRGKLYRLGNLLKNFLLFSSAYLALIAAAEVLIVTELLALPLTPAPIVAGLLTFAVYGNDRVADVETDETNTPARTAFVRRHHRLLYGLSALAYGLAVALAVLGGPAAFALALVPGLVWLCYAGEMLPDAVSRVKRVFVLNSVLVAGAWSLTVVFLPIAFAGARITTGAVVVSLFFLLVSFIDVEVPNVRDREGDRELGVRTLPVVVGVPGTRYALYAVAGLAAVTLVGAFRGGILGLAGLLGLSTSLVILFGVVACLGQTERTETLTVASECSRLPVLVLLFSPIF